MVSIQESFSLSGDGWGTTLSKEEQLAHKEYASKMTLGGGINTAYERDREREMDEMREEMGLKSGFDRDADLSSMKTSFIDGFLPKEKPVFDISLITDITKQIDEIKSKHAEVVGWHVKDINELHNKLDIMSKQIQSLETQIKELKQIGFFRRIYNRLFG
jgi:hypothetical protein